MQLPLMFLLFYLYRNMATRPSSLPPNSPASLESTSRRTRQCTRLKRLTIRHLDQLRLVVHVNPSVGKASGPLKENFHTYLGTIAQYKVGILYPNWKVVPKSLQDLIWDDILICTINHPYFSNSYIVVLH